MPGSKHTRKSEQSNSPIQEKKILSPEQAAPPHAETLRQSSENPHTASPEQILQLQRLYGNRAVSQMIASSVQRTVIQRNGGGKAAALQVNAQNILSGAIDLHDSALGLSEDQIAIIEALKLQIQNLEQMSLLLQQVEAAREAMYPKPIPLTSFIEFQREFQPLGAQSGNEILGLQSTYGHARGSHGAVDKLRSIFSGGLRPASQLGSEATRSGDAKANDIVSVNVIPPSKGKHAEFANYAATHTANGALPITIEQHGDESTSEPNIRALSQRSFDSALFIIDASKLSKEAIAQVQKTSDTNGGELGIGGAVGSGSFVCTLVPAIHASSFSDQDITQYKIIFVGKTESRVEYNVSGSGHSPVTISHPDYESALSAIFQANADKTLLTHVTRLGPAISLK